MQKLTDKRVRDISIVIPVFNKSMSIRRLYRQIKEVLNKIGKSYEIVFVDDGSRDNSFEILESIYNRDQKVKVIQLRRNFGKAAALDAGFQSAQGKIVITIDADLQDDPEEIPKFIKKIKEGYRLVNNVDLFGFMDGEKKFNIFKQNKIALHLATFDSGGMAAAEAITWSLPGVSFDREAIKVIILEK